MAALSIRLLALLFPGAVDLLTFLALTLLLALLVRALALSFAALHVAVSGRRRAELS